MSAHQPQFLKPRTLTARRCARSLRMLRPPAILLLALTLHSAGATQPALPPFDATTSLLVIAPHPDDETLCCAGAMQRVLAAGGQVSVVWITSGDGSILSLLLVEKALPTSRAKVRELAGQRMREARAATSLLGVPEPHQLFLGYPDGRILDMFLSSPASLHGAKFTGITQVPYSDALFPDHPYTAASLEHDLETVIQRVAPTVILAPSASDTHPDHSATGRFVLRLLKRHHETSKTYYWIVHGGEGWPSPREYMAGIPLDLPPAGTGLPLRPFTLTTEEQARKHQAIETYRTQMSYMAPFLLAFARTSELYSPTATPAPTATPDVFKGLAAAASDPTSGPTFRQSAPAAGRARPAAASSYDSAAAIARNRLRTPRPQ